ncbi:MAG TPA: glyoxalase/bleomycin resistance/extradiol dioxygenase family protein [Parafilimonas sp.]|nr:glyoxalase/bleomycin resistance/extradiol dioxygenase family protein [Parafilimonas sp.]
MELTPYLNFEGNAEEVLDFYKDALDGEIVMISRYKEAPMPSDEDWKNKIMHARLKFGKNMIMISDGPKDFKTTFNGNIQLSIEVEDENKMEEVFNKLAAGGKITMPLQKQFWGAKFGMLTDKFGTGWMLSHQENQ